MDKALKTQGKKSVANQMANLVRIVAAVAGSTPTPPACRAQGRTPTPWGGTPPGLFGIPHLPTPFRECVARIGFGAGRETGSATTGVGGVCHGA